MKSPPNHTAYKYLVDLAVKDPVDRTAPHSLEQSVSKTHSIYLGNSSEVM